MNHNCHGDWWPHLKVYRCLADSTLIRIDTIPDVCQACGRKVSPSTDNTARLERHEIDVIYSAEGHAFELDRRPIKAK
jgi:hypothetical protein